MAVEIRRAVVPPDRTAFAQGDLGRIDSLSSGAEIAIPALGLFTARRASISSATSR